MRPALYALSDYHPLPKKCASSLTGDINLESFHWNNVTMKIAYNFAFWQVVIVYYYLYFHFQEIAMPKAKY